MIINLKNCIQKKKHRHNNKNKDKDKHVEEQKFTIGNSLFSRGDLGTNFGIHEYQSLKPIQAINLGSPKKDSVKIYEIKRIIGKRYDEIEDLLDYFPYQVENDNGYPVIKITFDNNETKTYTPIQIAYLIFKKLIENAENYLNQKIVEVVITVPADFTDNQRNAIKTAAELNNGIKVKQIINEPCAAVLSYGFPSISWCPVTSFPAWSKCNDLFCMAFMQKLAGMDDVGYHIRIL